MVTTRRGSTSAPPSHAVASMAFRSVRQREEDFSDYCGQYCTIRFSVKCVNQYGRYGVRRQFQPKVASSAHRTEQGLDSHIRRKAGELANSGLRSSYWRNMLGAGCLHQLTPKSGTVFWGSKNGLECPDLGYHLPSGGIVCGAVIMVDPQVHIDKKQGRFPRHCPCRHTSHDTCCSTIIRRFPFQPIPYAAARIALLTRSPLYMEERPTSLQAS